MKSPTSSEIKHARKDAGLTKSQGGARDGAGAKPKGPIKRKPVTVRLSPDLIDKLKESGESQADQIEKALRGWFDWSAK